MKKIVFYMSLVIIFLVFPVYGFAQIEGMLDQQQLANLADRIAQVGKKRIAVVDFTDLQGNVTELGRFLAEEFSVALVGAGKGFEIIDRVHLKSILAEHKLALTGVIDPKTARELGKIAGVDAIVTGSITPFGDNIRVSFKVLDTETAMIIAASSGNIARTAAINELLARGIEPATAPSESRTEGSGTSQTSKGSTASKFGAISIIFKENAATLAKRTKEGSSDYGTARAWVEEYNQLLKETKSALKDDQFIQILQELKFSEVPKQASRAVNTAARKLKSILVQTK
jgi:TolB-like protein